jgi:hypothetical protein
MARAWQSAPAGYLVKPVSDHALRATLMRVLGDLSRPLRWRKPGADVWPASHRHRLRKA